MTPEKQKKLEERRKAIKDSQEGGQFTFLKADETKRIRILPVAENEESCMEVIRFYLGEKYKNVISPRSIGQPCAIMEKYNKLKESEPKLAEKFKPKKMYVAATIVYKDKLGKEIDLKQKPRLAMFTPGVYQAIIDLMLDPEHGEPEDPTNGYDLKWTRTGKGKMDTEYSIIPGKPSKLPKQFNKVYDLMEMLTPTLPTYAQTQEIIKGFLSDDSDRDEEEEDDAPKKKTKKPEGKKEKVLTDEKGPYKIVERDGKKVKVRPKA